jgi:hypothetical protein
LQLLPPDALFNAFTFLATFDLTQATVICRDFDQHVTETFATRFLAYFGDFPEEVSRQRLIKVMNKSEIIHDLSRSVDDRQKNLFDLFIWAASRGYESFILHTIDGDGDFIPQLRSPPGINTCTKNEQVTALYVACEAGCFEVLPTE